jgi:hypothetical protein
VKWIKTKDGERCHVVFRRHDEKTACGIPLSQAAAIVQPGGSDRCAACDYEWREVGAKRRRQLEAKEKFIRAAEADVYEPRFSFEDFDA